MSKENKTTRSVYADNDLWASLENLAARLDRTVNWVAARALEKGLEIMEKETK